MTKFIMTWALSVERNPTKKSPIKITKICIVSERAPCNNHSEKLFYTTQILKNDEWPFC
jgi:hypothetical protein